MPAHQRGGVLDRKYVFEYDVGLWTLGTVQVLKDRMSGSLKLCKTVQKNSFPSARDAASRLKRLEELKHTHICGVEDVQEDAGRLFVISSRCDGGDLADWTVRVQEEGNWLQERTVAEYIRQALIALAHAHAHKVYHKDLRPSSLGLSSKMPDAVVKITDLGLAGIIDPEDTAVRQGPSPYTAPEVLAGTGKAVPGAADIWSIGAIAHSLLVGHPPSQDESAWKVGAGLLTRRGAENDGWSDRSPASRDFVRCLLQQAEHRPGAARALQHPWLTGVVSLDPSHWDLGTPATRELQNRIICYMLAVLLVPECMQYREWFNLRQSFAQSDSDHDGLVARHVAHRLLKDANSPSAAIPAALDAADVRKTDQFDLCAVASAFVLAQEIAAAGQPIGLAELVPRMITRFFQTYGDPQQNTTHLAGVNASLCTAVMRDFEAHAGVRFDDVLLNLPEEGTIDSQAVIAGLTRSGGRGTPLSGSTLSMEMAPNGVWGEALSIEGLGDLFKSVFQTCGLNQQRQRERAFRSNWGGR